MRISRVARLAALVATLSFAACGGPPQQSTLPSPGAPPGAALARPGTHTVSWMGKSLKQQDLLYVSNGDGVVNVYRYWQHTLVGVLTDFTSPQGECSDSAGNVYIVDENADKIYEYAHGGTKTIRILDDSPYTPFGCSVDLANGNLAVANYGKDYYYAGNIAVYRHGKGTPVLYSGADDDHFVSCAYDQRGDLFAVGFYGFSSYYYPDFHYLPKNGSQLLLMNLPGPSRSWTWYNAQSVGWDGKYWTVLADDTLYRYIINVKAYYVSLTTLSGGYGIVHEVKFYHPLVKSHSVEVVGAGGGASKASVDYWNYPAGGGTIGQITKGLDAPYGVAISLGTP
jgi:hypothetical protein